MPCRSDYLDPNQREKDTKEAASLIVFVNEQLGLSTPRHIQNAAADMYGNGAKLKELVPMLCGKLKAMSPELYEAITNNKQDKNVIALIQWWTRHQTEDQIRELKELADQKQKLLIDQAKANLTQQQREELGL